MSIANEYIVPIQDAAAVGDIVVVGIFGPTVTTPSGWTVVAHAGTCTLYSHTVAAGEAGTNVLFSFSTPALAACFVLNVKGSTGVTGRIAVSPTAVSAFGLTVSNSVAPLIVAGCFSTLSQRFTPPAFAVNTTVNAAGIGTHCPSVVFGQTSANAVLTFGAGLVTNLFSFELDFTGTSPVLYGTASTTQGDIPPASIAFGQQTTATATSGTTMNLPSLTLNLNDFLVCQIEFQNKTQLTTVSDNNSGTWTEVTGNPVRNTTANTTFDMWTSAAHPSGATVVKVTDNSTITHLGANLSTYTGVATSSPIDSSNTDNTGNGTVNNALSGLVTPSAAATWIVGGTQANGAWSAQSDYGTGGGSPTRLTQVVQGQALDSGYQAITPNGTLTYGIQNNYTTTQFWSGCVIALKPVPVGTLPLPILRGRQRHRISHTVAKRRVRSAIELFTRVFPALPLPGRHSKQIKRIPRIRPKPRVRNAWIVDRQVTAPHADFPPPLRHRQQPKRVPHVRAKPRVKERLLYDPLPPHADFPEQIRRRQQPKRIPHTKAKRPLHASNEIISPPAPSILPPALRHGRIPKRIPRVKAKPIVRNSIELRIPQAPQIIFPPALRHGRIPKRVPRVKAKPVVKSSIELRIPQAPSQYFPPNLRRQQQPKRIPRGKAKRAVRNAIELTIPQAPAVITPPTIFPPTVMHGRIPKRIPRVKAKRAVRSSVELTIPQAPPAIFPPELRRKQQSKRVPHNKGKRTLRSANEIISPPAPSFFPPTIRRRQPAKRIPRVAAKKRTRSSIELRIPQAPPAQRVLPLPVFARHRVRRRPFTFGKRPWILVFYGVHGAPPPPTLFRNNPLISSVGKTMNRQ